MSFREGSMMARASSGSSPSSSSIEPLMSTNSDVTVFRSSRRGAVVPPSSKPAAALPATPISALPQSPQNLLSGGFAAPQFPQRIVSGCAESILDDGHRLQLVVQKHQSSVCTARSGHRLGTRTRARKVALRSVGPDDRPARRVEPVKPRWSSDPLTLTLYAAPCDARFALPQGEGQGEGMR